VTDEPLLTLRAIADELGLPESTVRYYRDLFEGYLPVSGRGRRRRYPRRAIDLLRLAADGFAEGRHRQEIGAQLAEATGAPPPPPGAIIRHAGSRAGSGAARELLAVVLDGERERREAMWQMAREIMRLGEAIERQQVTLGELAHRIEQQASHALPAGPDVEIVDGDAEHVTTGRGAELDGLRAELARERELVDRLRRSKLDLERRAAEAEAALADAGLSPRRVP